jgi:hypothetical protein
MKYVRDCDEEIDARHPSGSAANLLGGGGEDSI